MTNHSSSAVEAKSQDGATMTLFSPISIGAIALAHRVVHAPPTRLRADPDHSPSKMMVDYYGQRASEGGLIITESAHPSYDSRGYEGAPDIYTQAHVDGWRRVTDAVHARGGRVIMQLAHDGRQSHVDLSHGADPIAPSVVPFEGLAFTKDGWVPVSPHRALAIDEIADLVQSFRRAAELAKAAGMDGVELHNANGYLADTFLQDGTNKRTDAYGGSIDNSMRFSMELLEALLSVWGAGRVGVRLTSTPGGWVQPSPHRALETAEIAGIVEDYRRAAERPKAAGFDGAELHGANGYLVDQFLQNGSNKRTDGYGGSVENRSRLLLEIAEAMTSVLGADRTAVRIGPNGRWNAMGDSDPVALFDYVAQELNRFGLAYIHIIEPRVRGNVVVAEGQAPVAAENLRKIFKGRIIAAGGFDPETAEAIVEKGDADLVAFGRHFISNPDLPDRIAKGLPLSPYDRDTFYTFDAKGYRDYTRFGTAA